MEPAIRWSQTWECLDRSPPPGLIDELVSAYGLPHRAYHTLRHLAECFEQLDGCPAEASNPGLLELSLWFHDAVYEPRASDNEAQSARWAREALPMLSVEDLDVIDRLIIVTKHDATPTSPDERLLLDVDLSILGSPRARFHEYEDQIRREYSWVPEAAYRTARSRILREFQARPFIYHTRHFRDALEDQARVNLQSSIDSLAG